MFLLLKLNVVLRQVIWLTSPKQGQWLTCHGGHFPFSHFFFFTQNKGGGAGPPGPSPRNHHWWADRRKLGNKLKILSQLNQSQQLTTTLPCLMPNYVYWWATRVICRPFFLPTFSSLQVQQFWGREDTDGVQRRPVVKRRWRCHAASFRGSTRLCRNLQASAQQ